MLKPTLSSGHSNHTQDKLKAKNMETIRSEGIILQSLPLRDWDLLITAFTKEFGVMKFYYKKGQSKKRNKGALTSPLTCAEFICRKGNFDLIPLSEISVIDLHIDLRKTLEFLEYSCSWLKLIQRSQLPGKPAPNLYLLLKAFLRSLPQFPKPETLHACFLLKLLRHEGLIELNPFCSVCNEPAAFQAGEPFCASHCSTNAIPFNANELDLMQTLTFCRSLKEIENERIDFSFLEKISQLYKRIAEDFSTC